MLARTKRWMLGGLALVLLAMLTAPAAFSAEFNWRKFEGTTIHGIVFAAPYVDAWIRPQLDQFEEETGINVRLEVLVDTQMRKKQDIILAGEDPSMDFFMLQMDNRGGALTAAGHMENLEPYVNDPELTPPGYGYPEDWAGGCLNTERVFQDQPLNNIVFSAQAQLLHIRTDLFKKHNVKIPATMEELEEAARKLTIDEDGDGRPETFGFLSRGWGRLTTASFASYLWNHGGSWFRFENGKKVSNINSKESVDAFELYGRLIREYGPEAALNNRPSANAALFAAGKVAMVSALNYYVFQFEDPQKSRIAGDVATILVPRGPAGSYPNLPTTSLAVSPYSKKKGAAWTFIAWFTQQEKMLYGQTNGAPMCRSSVWEDPSYEPINPAWGESAKLALEYGIAIAKPQAIAISEMRDAAGHVANVAIRDGSREAIQAEADKQAEVMNQLIAETEQGLEFRGVFREGAAKMPAAAQSQPIEAAMRQAQIAQQ